MLIDYLKTTEIFETSDLALASALCYFDHQIEAINKQNPNKSIFVFFRNEKTDQIIESFWKHELVVDPARFFVLTKEIKSRLYNN
ncbi:MAG TPA: DUF5659 domain-containing protein [bacterium]|nr:DUF5659 domain-containing protein [bacterium]